ncbi:MAG: hypothetical protein EZS28_048891, partial [Streblomastix strix]
NTPVNRIGSSVYQEHIQTQCNLKKTEIAALIERLNFLRTQFREASRQQMLIDQVKTTVIKTYGWTGMIVQQLNEQKELHMKINQQKKTRKNKQWTQFHKQQSQQTPHLKVEAIFIQNSREVLVAHGAQQSYRKH